MTYLFATSKVATAVNNHATGLFAGSSDRFVVLNRGNVLSLFRIDENTSLENTLIHIQDFRLFCALKHVHSVAILNPITRKIERHILFLSSAKHEISLVTLRTSSDDEGRYAMDTLYYGKVPDAYQQSLHLIQTVSCSTDLSPTAVTSPFIAMAVGAGDLHFIDVFAAIGSHLSTKATAGAKKVHQSVFSPAVVRSMEKRSKLPPCLKIPFHVSEYEVKSMSFGSVSEDGLAISLYILSADRASNMQISEYYLSLSENATRTPDASLSPSFLSFIRFDQVVRKRCLQNNVDPTVSCILSSVKGVICVGSHLITFIPLQTHDHSLTIEMPFEDYLECTDVDAALLPSAAGEDCIVCTIGERCAVVVFDHRRVPLHAYVRTFNDNVGTVPSTILPLNFSTCLFCSQLQDTIVVNLDSWTRWTVLENCGPVLDMAVEGADSSVVLASTGAESHGGLTVLRSIVNLTTEVKISLPQNAAVSRVMAAGEIIVLKAWNAVFVQFFHSNHSVHEVILRSLSAPLSSYGDLINIYCRRADYVFVFEGKAVHFSWTDDSKCTLRASKEFFPEQIQDGALLFSSYHTENLVLSSSHSLFFLSWPLEYQWTIPFSFPVSAVTLQSGVCVVGMWDCSVSMIDLSAQSIVGKMHLDAVPRSICCVSSFSSPHLTLLIGLTSGYLCVTTSKLLIEGRFQQYFLLAKIPLDLFVLNDRTVISLGLTPMLLLSSREGFFIRGFGVDGVLSCGTLRNGSNAKHIFYSKTGNSLHIGELEKTENKMNGTFLPLGGTVTMVRIISSWGGSVIALRRKSRESILFLSSAYITGSNAQPVVEQRCDLLENEQCIFLESISLEFPGEVEEQTVLLAGTSFVFREVQIARASRIMWFPRGSKGELNPIGEKDIKGSLYSCCVVPHSSGEVVLAVSGVIILYKWSAREMTFIKCEELEVGLMVFRLLPVAPITVYPIASSASSTIVAFDCRFGAIYIEVNTRKGVMSIISKESRIREATAGAILYNEAALIADRNDNILILQRVKDTKKQPSSEAESADNVSKRVLIRVRGQFHVGQCINCLERGSCASVDFLTSKTIHFASPQSNQVIFGTAQGAFGTITPVDFPAYFVLRALEYAMARVEIPVGSFFPEDFRTTSAPGNLMSDAGEWRGHSSTPNRKPPFSRRCVVDGDVIKSFLFLSKSKRGEVLNVATQTAVSWWPLFHTVWQDCDGTTDFFPPTDSSSDANPDNIQEKCNETLFAARLPLLPFMEDQVLQFIFFIQQLS